MHSCAWKRCAPSEGFLHIIPSNQTCRTFAWAGNALPLPPVSQVTVAPSLDWALELWDDLFIMWVSFHSALNVVTTRNRLFFLCHSVFSWLRCQFLWDPSVQYHRSSLCTYWPQKSLRLGKKPASDILATNTSDKFEIFINFCSSFFCPFYPRLFWQVWIPLYSPACL